MMPSDLEVVTGGAEPGVRMAQRSGRTHRLLARLVEIGLSVPDRVLGLALLVAQMLDVGMGERSGRGAQDECPSRTDNGQASAGGGGEESHR